VDGALNIGDESQLPWDWSIKKFAAKLFSFHRGRPLPINNLKPSWGMKSAAFASLQRSIIPRICRFACIGETFNQELC